MSTQLILSLFTGIGLFDEAFRREGFCVVSAGDIITGQDINNFKSLKGRFDGVIGGSPCQEFSTLKRKNKTDYSDKMIEQFVRIVQESDCSWYCHENVKGVPDVAIEGYTHQRIIINQGWYDSVQRTRVIQYGYKVGEPIFIPRGTLKKNLRTLATASDERSFNELLELQGLPDDFELPDMTVKGKKKLVGNAVPLSIGTVVAKAIKQTIKGNLQPLKNEQYNFKFSIKDESSIERCICGCGQPARKGSKYHHRNCGKQLLRRTDKKIGFIRFSEMTKQQKKARADNIKFYKEK